LAIPSAAPIGTQRGNEQQVGFVFGQQYAARWQPPDFAADSPFFLAVGIGFQHVARPLPNVIELPQSAADGVVGKLLPQTHLQRVSQ
jgi:hypothetical protein